MPEWSRVNVYDVNNEVIGNNLSVYRATSKIRPSSFEGYVKAAIDSGNHLVFAREFIDTFIMCGKYSLPYKELKNLAARKVEEYLCRNAANKKLGRHGLSSEQKQIVKMHKRIQASYYIKDTSWRSPDCNYPLDEMFSKKEEEAGSTDRERKENNRVVYSKHTRENWRKGASIKRDVLVQHALVIGLNADETDELLMRAGYPGLYPLDAVDACAIINLNEYAGRLDISPYEVLRKVKSDINHILSELEGPDYVFVGTGTADGAKQGILTYAAGRYIDKDLKGLRDLLGNQNIEDGVAFPADVGLTRFLTKYYSEKIRNTHDAASYFHDPGIEANVIFTQRCYGFLKKTKEYLYDWRRYRKNLLPCTWKLTPSFADHDFVNDRRFKLEKAVYDCNIKAILEKLEKAEGKPEKNEVVSDQIALDSDSKNADISKEQVDSDQYYEDCLRLIQYVRAYDVLSDPPGLIFFKPNQKNMFTNGRVMLEGEKKNFKETASDATGEDETSISGYVFEMKKKHYVVRFALSAGREEEIGEYLILARYWKRDWYREISGGMTMAECQEEGFYPDSIDKLVIYALLYRDMLIEKWCGEKGNREVTKKYIRDMFPMRELILEISYDITFAFLYGTRHIHTVAEKNLEELNDIYAEFENLRRNMIFPVQWTDRDGIILTYDREQSTYKNAKQDTDKNKKKPAPQKEDAER